ncbi:MAG: nitrilase-related carbon-nitrogen hydrolase [Phycisphaerales bacterium]
MPDRYYAAACQTSFECPRTRGEIGERVRRMIATVEQTLIGYEPFFDVRLFAFPEFAHAAPVYDTVAELDRHLAIEVPNEHTDRYAQLCAKAGIWIQTGSFIERHPRAPGRLFNTTALIGPGGVLALYRKVNPWIPWEVHASPHDVPDLVDDPFPVTTTEIGKLGVAICYDWLFPETLREMAFKGCEVAMRISAYMDPWGATPPMDWWTVVNRTRAIENTMYVVASNQGATLRDYPPFSWPGGSMVVDFDGRILAQADAGPGEKVVVAPIDLAALRAERARRFGHDMRAHLRSEAFTYLARPRFERANGEISVESLRERIRDAKERLHEG